MSHHLKSLRDLTPIQVKDCIWFKLLYGPTYAVLVKTYHKAVSAPEIKSHWQEIVGNVVTVKLIEEVNPSTSKPESSGRAHVEFKTAVDMQRALTFNGAPFSAAGNWFF